jgi:hypothetical protein
MHIDGAGLVLTLGAHSGLGASKNTAHTTYAVSLTASSRHVRPSPPTHHFLFTVTQSVAHWKQFFSDHKSYTKVGRVNHPPIDPTSPLPVHCEPKKEVEQKARWGAGPAPLPVAQEKAKEGEVGQETVTNNGGTPATHEEL